jgi:ketosteroid isomerase-like protein
MRWNEKSESSSKDSRSFIGRFVMLADKTKAQRAIAALIETYRQGFLRLDPARIASIWDPRHEPLIYVAQEKKEPIYGWPAIERYIAALPEHLEKVLAKELKELQIDVLGDTAVAFFISHSSVKLKARAAPHEPTFRVTVIFQQTSTGWRAIHFHESALSAQAVAAMS